MKEAKKKNLEAQTEVTQDNVVAPKIVWKGQQSFRHDLFKLEVARCKKNISWKKKRPELVNVEHVHFYHSHTNRGDKQNYSVPVANHFHEIKTHIAPDGTVVATCGPAVKKVQKALSTGKIKTTIEPVAFEHEELGTLTDDHTHDVSYLSSEQISQDHIRQIQTDNAQGLKKMGVTSAPKNALEDLNKGQEGLIQDAPGSEA